MAGEIAEDTKTVPQPVVPVAPVQPKTLTERYGIWVMILALAMPLLTAILQNRGIITADQKSSLDKSSQSILLMSQNEAGDVTLQEVPVEKPSAEVASAKGRVVPAKPPAKIVVEPKPKADDPPSETRVVHAIDPKLQDLLDKLLPVVIDKVVPWLDELLKPKPAPHPDPTPNPQPKPDPNPPSPHPPNPQPNDSRIVLTDESGKVLTSATVEAGALFLATSSTAGKVAWAKSSHGSVRVLTLPQNLGFSFSLANDAFVEFFLTDATLTTTSIRVTCNRSPQPHPGPTPPQPDPQPPTPTVSQVSLVVVHDVKAITPSAAVVLNATNAWNEFTKAGNDWLFFDKTTTEPQGKQAIADAAGVTLPALVIYDRTSRVKLAAMPLPSSVESLKTTVAKYAGVK